MSDLTIDIDDLGLDLLAQTPTPRIDETMADGYVVPRFVGAPNCSNFRAQRETGLYNFRQGNLIGRIFRDFDTCSMATGGTLASHFSVAEQIGKWHLCAQGDLSHRSAAGYVWFDGSQANIDDYWNWDGAMDGIPYTSTEYATDYVTAKTIRSLARGADLVVASFNAVHKPHHAPPGMSMSGPGPMLIYLDDMIGRVYAEAKRRGYRAMPMSDNGGTSDDGGKGNLSHQALATICVLVGWDVEPRLMQAADVYAMPTGDESRDGIADGGRSVAFADKWLSLCVPPGDKWKEMATDGERKVIRTVATGEYECTDWYGQPTGDDCGGLLDALELR